jgi:hypothetical protein
MVDQYFNVGKLLTNMFSVKGFNIFLKINILQILQSLQFHLQIQVITVEHNVRSYADTTRCMADSGCDWSTGVFTPNIIPGHTSYLETLNDRVKVNTFLKTEFFLFVYSREFHRFF